MKTPQELQKRLDAEEAACKTDPTLKENDFVQGYMEGLRFALEEDRK
jgi:hypothetical protein